MIFDFLFKKHECRHLNIRTDVEEAYCPDCGELIVNKWYLVRCSCCNIKRNAHLEYDKIKPDTKYCPNCGSADFYITELEHINFVDVHYAVIKREIKKQGSKTVNQIWVEIPEGVKLLGGNFSQ